MILSRLLARAALAGLLPALTLTVAPGAAAAEEHAIDRGPVVVVGVGGLTWESVSPERTPALWDLLEGDAAAGTSTLPYLSSQPCAIDGWLTLSAGNRVADPWPDEEVDEDEVRCRDVPVQSAPDGSGQVLPWRSLREHAEDTVFEPRLGALAEALSEHGDCATAVGPGAGLALADSEGRIARYRPDLPAEAGTVFGCPLTVIDAGSLTPGPDHITAQTADRLVGTVLDAAPSDASVLVVGLSFEIEGRRDMGVAVLAGAAAEHRYLSVATTRRDGIVRLQDVPTTLTTALQVPTPGTFVGAPFVLGEERPGAADTVADLREVAERDRLLRSTAGTFINVLFYGALIVVAAAVLLGRRRRDAWTTVLEVLAWMLAALPVASFLVTLTGWWQFSSPLALLWVLMGALAGAIAGAALWTRPSVTRPVLVVSGLTVAVLLVDAVAGTPLHAGSPLGPSPMVGSRYYGFGNETFGVWAVHVLLLCTALATSLIARSRPQAAVALVGVVGGLAVVIEVWPTLGADVGGGLALVPAVLVLGLALSGRRVTVRRLAIGALAGVLTVLAIGFADWLRPPEQRTHVGRFFQQILDGTAQETLLRKADYALSSFVSGVPAVVSLLVLIVVIVVVVGGERRWPQALARSFAAWPQLHAACLAVIVLTVVGVLGNDYGIRIARITLAMALPVVAALMLRCTGRSDPSAAPPPPDRAGVRSDATL